MSKFEDYINSLEGKENIDPLVVASTLHELHTEEVGIRDAKIESLEGGIAEKDAAIADVTTKLTEQKAKNFDLAMNLPSTPIVDNDEADKDNEAITIDDLFERK